MLVGGIVGGIVADREGGLFLVQTWWEMASKKLRSVGDAWVGDGSGDVVDRLVTLMGIAVDMTW